MIGNCGNMIPASNAIKHIQLRLSAEKMPSIAMQPKAFEDTEKMIEYLRWRLRTSAQPEYGNGFAS